MLSKKSKLLLCGLLLACITYAAAAAAINENDQQNVRILYNSDEKDVNFQTTLIGSDLADIIWCGENKESVLVVTEGGVVYYSSNGGLEWKKLKNIFQRAGSQVSDEEDIGIVESLRQSPLDHQLVFFLGSEGIHWYTEDCGKTIKALDTGKYIHNFQFHPVRREWWLASTFTVCDEESDKPCKKSQELYVTQDLGSTWKLVADFVIQFSWAVQDSTFLQNIPLERIVITQDLRNKVSQKIGGWSEDTHLVYSDDFFKSQKSLFSQGQKFLITKSFFFVVRVEDEAKQDVSLYISDPTVKHYKFQPIRLPSKDKFYERSYVILDTNEGQVFLHVNHEHVRSKFGHIYISDSTGLRYSLSLRNNVRTQEDLSDFETVQGLEGIFIANIYDNTIASKAKNGLPVNAEVPTEKGGKKPTGKGAGASHADKRVQDLDEFKQTRITFDKGGMWSPLNPPKFDALGERIECEDKDCSLHLHSMSNSNFGPFYTTENSLGLILGTGNVGKYLSNKQDEVNTYLSRDGGLNWYEIKQGSHIYEVGDHGSIIVVASDQKATKNLFYTWNEGLSWSILQISETPIEVENIIIEPSNTAQKFIVYGRTSTSSEGGKGAVKARKGVLIGVDFSSMHERICELPDKPNSENSDYETWSPNGHIVESCLMGHKVTYARRKRQAECFNPQDLDKIFEYKNCQCTEEDWECDIGFERKGSGPCMLPPGKEPSYEPPQECNGYYTISSGYRKVAGNTCEGGINHEAIKFPCPSNLFSKKSATILLGLAIAGLVAWIIANRTGQIRSIFFTGSFKNPFNKQTPGKSLNMKEFKQLIQDEDADGGVEDHEDLAEKIRFDDDGNIPSPFKSKSEEPTGRRMTDRKGLETASKNIPTINKPQQDQIMRGDDDEDEIGGFDTRN